MLGFDHHGTHYFGPYANGLSNTPEHRRIQHMKQFEDWAARNKKIKVVNCTEGSALKAFPAANLDEVLPELTPTRAD